MNELNEPVVVEQSFTATKERVWAAITEHAQMVQWFFEGIPDFMPEPGFRTEFNVNTGQRDFCHIWKITESVPQVRIVYDWRYRDLPGVGKVTFEIFAAENGTRLRVTNEGLESFPTDIPEFSRESCVGGWRYFIQGALKDFLEQEAAQGYILPRCMGLKLDSTIEYGGTANDQE